MDGVLAIRIKRGINLAIRNTDNNYLFVLLTKADQKFKTPVVKADNCNPEWNEELTFSVPEINGINTPIHLTVFVKDTVTEDDDRTIIGRHTVIAGDKMGEADIDIKPYVECLIKMRLTKLPNGCVVKTIQPTNENGLVKESQCVLNDGKIVQEMTLKLRNVECGEVAVEIEWLNIPGCTGLEGIEEIEDIEELEVMSACASPS